MLNRREVIGRSLVGASILSSGLIGSVAQAFRPYPIFDTHCHLISDDQVRYPRVQQNPRATVAADGSVEPPPPLPGTAYGQFYAIPTINDVIKWMAENGVVRAASVQKKGTYGFDNSYVVDASDVVPSVFRSVAVVDAEDAATPAQVRELAANHKFSGIRLTGPAGGDFAWLVSPAAKNVLAVANELSLTLDLMAVPPGYSAAAINHYKDIARAYPNILLVINHFGWPTPQDADFGLNDNIKSMADFANVYQKLTTINIDFLDAAEKDKADFLRMAIDIFGADKIMWGSDIGNSAGTYAELVARAEMALTRLTEAERRQVMFDTGNTVYWKD